MPSANNLSSRSWLGGLILLSICFVFLAGCSDIIHKKAMTREEALESGVFRALPLPESATNIFYYLEVSGFQVMDSFIRFDVSAAELDSAVDVIIASDNVELKQNLAYTRQTLPVGVYYKNVTEEATPDWWTLDSITHGYYRGELAAYAARLWIDEKPYFTLTETSFEKLQEAGVPHHALETLDHLKDKEFVREGEMLDAVENSLGEEQTNTYKDLILKYADAGEIGRIYIYRTD